MSKAVCADAAAARAPKRSEPQDIPNLVVLSDPHCGCGMGLFPDRPVTLDTGMVASQSRLQAKVWEHWVEWRDRWIPDVTKGEPFVLVVNGDAMDGDHHDTKTTISRNHADQQRIAYECLAPLVERAAAFYYVRGTEAHGGKSDEFEELLARSLGALPDDTGNHARWELWLELCGHLGHIAHHIGTTGSSGYESTALHKEVVEAFVEAGRWGLKPPQYLIRSHRHRQFEERIACASGNCLGIITPGWQLKTPLVHRLTMGRASQPQIGGYLVRAGDRALYSEFRVWGIERPRVEVARA